MTSYHINIADAIFIYNKFQNLSETNIVEKGIKYSVDIFLLSAKIRFVFNMDIKMYLYKNTKKNYILCRIYLIYL